MRPQGTIKGADLKSLREAKGQLTAWIRGAQARLQAKVNGATFDDAERANFQSVSSYLADVAVELTGAEARNEAERGGQAVVDPEASSSASASISPSASTSLSPSSSLSPSASTSISPSSSISPSASVSPSSSISPSASASPTEAPPTNAWDVQLLDQHGLDRLQGLGIDRDDAATVEPWAAEAGVTC